PYTTLFRSRQTEPVADRVGALISSQPEVEMAMETVQEGTARIFITLKPDRKRSSIEFERALAPRLATFPDARVSFASQQGGAGTGRDISVMLSGSDPAVLE